jgi:hypothetical protein
MKIKIGADTFRMSYRQIKEPDKILDESSVNASPRHIEPLKKRRETCQTWMEKDEL